MPCQSVSPFFGRGACAGVEQDEGHDEAEEQPAAGLATAALQALAVIIFSGKTCRPMASGERPAAAPLSTLPPSPLPLLLPSPLSCALLCRLPARGLRPWRARRAPAGCTRAAPVPARGRMQPLATRGFSPRPHFRAADDYYGFMLTRSSQRCAARPPPRPLPASAAPHTQSPHAHPRPVPHACAPLGPPRAAHPPHTHMAGGSHLRARDGGRDRRFGGSAAALGSLGLDRRPQCDAQGLLGAQGSPAVPFFGRFSVGIGRSGQIEKNRDLARFYV